MAFRGRQDQVWGVLSQGLNTAGNLLLAVVVAGQSTPADFGAWSLAYIAYLAALQVSRNVLHRPLMLSADRQAPHAAINLVLAWACATGLLLGLAGLLVVDGPVRWVTVIFGCAMPVLLAQDSLRYLGLRTRRARLSARSDATWLAVQGAGVIALLVSDRASAPTLTAAWAVGGAAGLLTSPLLGRLVVPARLSVSYARTNRSKFAALTGEVSLLTLSTHLVPIVLAWTAGLAAAGALRAGQTMMGVVSTCVAGLVPLITVEVAADRAAGTPARVTQRRWSMVIAVIAALNAVVIFGLPDSWGRALFAQSWHLAAPILPALVVQTLVRGPVVTAPLLLQGRDDYAGALWLRLRTTVPAVLLPVVGAAGWGLPGAAWGITAAALLNAAQCGRAVPRSGNRPMSGDLR